MTTTFAQTNSFDMIDISFCNNHQSTREVDIISQAGKTLPICVEFTNKSSTSIKINVEFLDSVITADSQKDRACNGSDRPKTQFGNFILPYTGETILAPQSTIQKTYDIKYPIGFSGLSHGCLAYNIIGTDINDGSMFTVRVRAVKYLDILVSDSKVIQTVDLSQKPILKKV